MELVPATAVGATGVPNSTMSTFCCCTNAVVANCVLDVLAMAVGAVGVPMKFGLLVTKAVVAN